MAPGANSDDFRSGCPIASTLDLVGDRWSLVVMRDLVNGKARYKDFLDSPEKIASNILAARLAAMENAGLIESTLYQQRPKRYEYHLTPKGAALLPVLQAICKWGESQLPERWKAPASFMRKKPADLVQK
jgi:DNA-binding HxlR family transcriptional regulator